MSKQFSGIVKWFNKELGFGFISVAPSLKLEFGIPADRDLYVHAENVETEFPKVLKPEQRVTFDVQVQARGPRAVNVTVAA